MRKTFTYTVFVVIYYITEKQTSYFCRVCLYYIYIYTDVSRLSVCVCVCVIF